MCVFSSHLGIFYHFSYKEKIILVWKLSIWNFNEFSEVPCREYKKYRNTGLNLALPFLLQRPAMFSTLLLPLLHFSLPLFPASLLFHMFSFLLLFSVFTSFLSSYLPSDQNIKHVFLRSEKNDLKMHKESKEQSSTVNTERDASPSQVSGHNPQHFKRRQPGTGTRTDV